MAAKVGGPGDNQGGYICFPQLDAFMLGFLLVDRRVASLERVLAICTFAPNLGLCLVVGWKLCAFDSVANISWKEH